MVQRDYFNQKPQKDFFSHDFTLLFSSFLLVESSHIRLDFKFLLFSNTLIHNKRIIIVMIFRKI